MGKKLLTVFLALIMMMAIFSGCTPDTDKSSDDRSKTDSKTTSEPGDETPKEVTITIANWPKADDEAGLATYAEYEAKMKELYPYITIEKDEWGYDVSSFLAKASSGNLPTLFDTYFTDVGKIISAGYAADLTDAMAKHGYTDALNKDLLDLVQSGDKYYALPQSGYFVGLMVNLPVFEEAGLIVDGLPQYPTNLDELVSVSKTIKEKTGKPGFFFPTKSNQGGWMFMNIAWAYGADFEVKDGDKWKAVFNSQEAVDALQFVRDLKWVHDILPENNLVDVNDLAGMLGTDQVGMAFGLQDWAYLLVNMVGMDRDNLAMAAMPAGPKGATPVLGGGAYIVAPTATPEQIDAVFKWLGVIGYTPGASEEEISGRELRLKDINEENHLVLPPALRVWSGDARVKAEDEVYDKYVNIDRKLWASYLDDGSKGMRPEVPVNAQELYQLLDGVIQEVLTNENADLQKLLDDAVANFQSNYLDVAED